MPSRSKKTTTIRLKHFHPGQTQVMADPARFKVVACGRRWGKTELGIQSILYAALAQKKRCWWVAPTHRMASQVWRALRSMLRPVNGTEINASERRIDLPNGGMIEVCSAWAHNNLRGEGLDFAVLDEAAFMNPEFWIEIIRPMLITTRGGALFLSTPNGCNWFRDLFQLGADPDFPDWQSFHFTTADNPLIDPVELADVQALTPEHVWNSEYLAQFSDDSGLVFRGISDAVAAQPVDGPQPGRIYTAGVDWGRSKDYTAIAIIDATTGQMTALDRFSQVGWDLQRKRLKALVERWQPQVIWAESNSIGEPNIEALVQEGLPIRPFFTSAKSKPPLIESLALAIERQALTLLDDPVLLRELADYALKRLPSGYWRYSAPAGGHDDTVIATALAWHGAQYHTRPSIDFA